MVTLADMGRTGTRPRASRPPSPSWHAAAVQSHSRSTHDGDHLSHVRPPLGWVTTSPGILGSSTRIPHTSPSSSHRSSVGDASRVQKMMTYACNVQERITRAGTAQNFVACSVRNLSSAPCSGHRGTLTALAIKRTQRRASCFGVDLEFCLFED